MKDLKYFRWLLLLEGYSLLAMLFIAMPLRWWTGEHMYVRVTGTIHGILFLIFLYMLIQVAIERSWKFRKVLLALVLGSLPFGSFIFEKRYLEPV